SSSPFPSTLPRPLRSSLFPYTTLFRSRPGVGRVARGRFGCVFVVALSRIRSADRFGARPVVVPGGGDHFESVRRRLVPPPGEFFRIVAGGAQSRGVVPAGFAAVGEGIGVVGMLDRCFAPWRAADVIANDDHAPEQTGEF